MANKATILIVGASRGLGLALAEQFCSRDWHVIATARGKSPGLDALKARFPASLEEETADIAEEGSVRALRQRLDGRTIDMLFVNAGIAKSITATPGTAPAQDFLDMMLVNAFSPVRLIEIFEDVVAPNGTIAAMSSELGSITNNPGHWDLYASSKAALDMLMKCYAAHRPDDRRAKLVVAPGFIQTEMGGPGATFTVEECIPLVADMLEKNHGKAGLRYVDRFDKTLPW
jgi:NAD(P)-dependent dehydrogenase (short-subunit alcohol dehydrogenase family)